MIPGRSKRRNGVLFTLLAFLLMIVLLLMFKMPKGEAQGQQDDSPDKVRFAHFSDVHYDAHGADKSWRLLKDSPTLLETALKMVSATPELDFVLFTGDSVNTPRPANFEGFFDTVHRQINLPFYMVLGNHDVGVKPNISREDTIRAFQRLGGKAAFPAEGRSWYSVSPAPWLRMIVLDGTTDEKVSANGFIPQEEFTWLAQELSKAKAGNQMVIVTSHFPLVEPFHSASHEIVKPDADKLLAMLEGCPNVVAYFAGHYHSAKIQQRNGIYYITSPSLVEYPNAYRIVTMTQDGKLSLSWQPTPLKELSEKSRERSPFYKTALGNPAKDHQLSLGQLRYRPSVSITVR